MPALDENGMSLRTNANQAMINNTLILSPTLINEFRFGFLGFFNNYAPELANKTDVVKQLGLPGLLNDPPPAAWGIPSITLANGFSAFGNNTDGPYTTWDYIFQWVDDVSWTHGSHSIKFGADIDRTRFNVTGSQYLRAQYGVQNQATGYTPSDFMLGYVHDTSDAAALAVAQFRQTSQAYYFQDSWKVRPNITISYGLRYEYVPAYSDKAPLANIWIPPGALFTQTPNAPANTHPCYVRSGTGDFYQNV